MVSLSFPPSCFRAALDVMRRSRAYSLLGLGGRAGVATALLPPAAEGPGAGWGICSDMQANPLSHESS